MNKVILTGKVFKKGAENGALVAEVRQFGDTKVAKFTISVLRPYKGKDGKYSSDFISCEAWGKSAEFAEKYLRQGSRFEIEGSWETGSYEKDGQRVFTNTCRVEQIQFGEAAPQSDSQPAPQAQASQPQAYTPQAQPQQGYAPQAQPQQAYAPQGYAPQGYYTPQPQAYAPQQYAPQGNPGVRDLNPNMPGAFN